jgi:soluble lytic murein transglycosylase-like protein
MHKTLILLAALMSAGYFGHAASADNSANNSANNFAGAQIANGRIAPQPRPDYQATQLPDAVLYKNIFSLQENGKWGRADRLIKKLEDTTLMGHVLFQRYMHPTAYRAKWTELRDWLKNYADQPGAWRVYKLAQKRKPRGVSMPKRPPSRVYFNERASAGQPLFRTRAARRIRRQVEYLVRRERPTQALKYISERAQDRRLKRTETHFLKSLIARSYYIEGKVAESLKLARDATESRAKVQMADWHAGLAAYRLNQIDTAITYFEQLAHNRTASAALRAKASYWAARSLRQNGDVEKAEQHFRAAARTGPNFYALLAMQHMRGGMVIEWRQAADGQNDLFIAHPAVRRAQALRQADQEELAELELLYLQERLSDIEARALMAFAREHQYPAVQLALASRLGGNQANGLPLPLLEGSYPIVDMTTHGVDRALVLALIRQESRFKARAKSHAGARGLMQIMPGTAAFVSGDWTLYRRRGRDQLLDAELNLEIGQKYLTMLMGETYFSGSLVHMLAAYNGGPGNVRRWRRELASVKDPLLFIESLPAPETRDYVQKVMANLWIYRDRLAQSPDSQRILAAESWPLYRAQDGRAKLVPAGLR